MFMIMLVPSEEDGTTSFTLGVQNHLQFLSLSPTVRETVDQEFRNNECIGSSYGWLILLKADKTTTFLLDSYSGHRIELPVMGFNPTNIQKAILSANPSEGQSFSVFVTYGINSDKMAYIKKGQEGWFCFGATRPVSDMCCHGDFFLALGKQGDFEVWDYISSGIPVNKCDFKTFFWQPSIDTWNLMRDVCTYRMYLLYWDGELLLVIRFVGKHVRKDGVAVHETDLQDGEVCPYRTVKFIVLKLNLGTSIYEEMATIGDHAIILGRNESILVKRVEYPACEANSIYYSDDHAEAADGDGGHDNGVYNIADGSIRQFYQRQSQGKIQPQPVWAVPPEWIFSSLLY